MFEELSTICFVTIANNLAGSLQHRFIWVLKTLFNTFSTIIPGKANFFLTLTKIGIASNTSLIVCFWFKSYRQTGKKLLLG